MNKNAVVVFARVCSPNTDLRNQQQNLQGDARDARVARGA